jgi:hypothetical protein
LTFLVDELPRALARGQGLLKKEGFSRTIWLEANVLKAIALH